jgi:hypothetical protein
LNNAYLFCSDAIIAYDYLRNISVEHPILGAEGFGRLQKPFCSFTRQTNVLTLKKDIQKKNLDLLKVRDFYFSNHNLYIFDKAKLHHFKIEKND